ncbi:hypothetical protein [Pseudogemmobacter faecipullorum]|uniref:Major capsid protein n=1 Tax=Pseudogemmobacter faecipullorum TaxID=2755041 RepID=A0ABS8CLP0_9RHOB|nr:hypothetical protein [Pseudogemmobacter faecipullorum]MCB5410303.1 hypothetical protein [Pseudogemmobacter faecipullorum]
MSFQTPRNTRREHRTIVDRTRAGKLNPCMAVAVRGNEGGMLSQSITMELDPIAGRMITPITAEFISVFVPVQAMYALRFPNDAYAGLTEVLREKLANGEILFGLDHSPGEISDRMGINPVSISGNKRVLTAALFAHNAAVNHLRLRKYTYATQLLATNNVVTPALIGQTVLDRFNAVLDPDDRINGAVQLDIPNMQLPVSGVGFEAANPVTGSVAAKLDAGSSASRTVPVAMSDNTSGRRLAVENSGTGATLAPKVFAQLNGLVAGGVSLSDFYNAEKMDSLTRTMRQIVDDNPEYGEEMVLRWAHGLSVDSGKTPFVIHQQTQQFGRNIVGATDTSGIQTDVMRSDMGLTMQFSVPIPRTELGGMIVTFCTVKPDETISSQPHPILSEPWGADNFAADELKIDPVPVTMRQLDSNILAASESTVAAYVGHNELKKTYVSYGLSRRLDASTVENKTAVWQLNVPLSVTPNNILYPENLSHYPFADQNAEVCTYTVTSNAVIQTPMIFGPTPVETLAIIGAEDIFEQE